MGTPLELVQYDANTKKFVVGKAALETLRSVKGPMGVVAVCGRARQGKSYILNQLLQTTGGFTVGPTYRPCTKGLWMWSAPQKRVAADGSEYHIVLLDTEGIDAYDQTAQYSTQIFSLAVLLSSLFVYNQMGGIDESALDRLSLVTEMTKHIRVKAGQAAEGGGGSAGNLGDFAPAFLWLLRDFYLKLEEDGRKVTPSDYLEQALLPLAGGSGAVEAKNAIRSSIKSLFPDRDCFTLVRPMHEENELCNLDQIPSSALRPEFRAGVRDLITRIFAKAQPKRIGSHILSGAALAGLVEAYVKAINDGAVPTIATAWQGVAESECRRAADAAEAKYVATFDATPCEPEEAALDAAHAAAVDAAKALYADMCVGEEKIRRAHEQKFLLAVSARYADVRGRRLAEAAQAVTELLYGASRSIAAAARSNAPIGDIQSQIDAFIQQYIATASGPTKWQRLTEFLKDVYPSLADEAVKRAQSEAAAKVEETVLESEEVKARAEQLEARLTAVDRAARDAAARSESLQSELVGKANEVADLRTTLDSKAARVAALEAQLKEALVLSERKVANAMEMMSSKVRSSAAEAQAKVAELASALAAEQHASAALKGDLAAVEARCKGLQASMLALQAENGEWRAKYHKLMQDKAELLRAKHEQADAATSLAMEKRALERQVGELSSQLAALQALLSHEEADSVSLANKLTALEKEARMMAAAARSVSRMQTQALAAATIASSSPMKAASLYSGSPSAGSSLRPVSALSPRSPHRL